MCCIIYTSFSNCKVRAKKNDENQNLTFISTFLKVHFCSEFQSLEKIRFGFKEGVRHKRGAGEGTRGGGEYQLFSHIRME